MATKGMKMSLSGSTLNIKLNVEAAGEPTANGKNVKVVSTGRFVKIADSIPELAGYQLQLILIRPKDAKSSKTTNKTSSVKGTPVKGDKVFHIEEKLSGKVVMVKSDDHLARVQFSDGSKKTVSFDELTWGSKRKMWGYSPA